MAAVGAVEEEAVAGEEVEAAVGVLAGDTRRMGMRLMGLDIHPMELGIHPMQPHGDRPPARNRRPSSSKTNKDSSSSKWRRSINDSKNLLLRKKSKGKGVRGNISPHPLANYIANYYILRADMIKVYHVML
jgi:hypothetical protein